MSNGRITEAALLIANVFERTKKQTQIDPDWMHHEKWTIFVNDYKSESTACHSCASTKVPPSHIAVWIDNSLAGVFSANEGYLNNADEFIADMKELLEKEAV